MTGSLVIGSWTGKCFNDFSAPGTPSLVMNEITPLAAYKDWTSGLDAYMCFPGDISIQSSVLDGKPVWMFDYRKQPQNNCNGLIGPVFGPFSSRTFDEVREVRWCLQ